MQRNILHLFKFHYCAEKCNISEFQIMIKHADGKQKYQNHYLRSRVKIAVRRSLFPFSSHTEYAATRFTPDNIENILSE